jgi:hypothetical protein
MPFWWFVSTLGIKHLGHSRGVVCPDAGTRVNTVRSGVAMPRMLESESKTYGPEDAISESPII